MQARANSGAVWNEIFTPDRRPRPQYAALLGQLDRLPRGALRKLDEGMEATLREMGVTFAVGPRRGWGASAWDCDFLPQIFDADEWGQLSAGIVQRLNAFELFLADIHGRREILRDGVIPVQVVLGSPYFQRPAVGLPRPGGHFLHLSGLAIARSSDGRPHVRHHYFANASGISYMMQNRRALARVMTPFFEGRNIHTIADTPSDIIESLRAVSDAGDPVVVLLSPGPGSAVYSEHLFLARRMGIPVVQGRDLLVHNDRVFLRAVSGLERIDIIYTRLADPWLDPLVFRADSLIGVPGLVHCIRKGTVRVLNAIGSQLADDRALLAFGSKILAYYLGERPLVPSVPTLWLGDIDQRELVLSEPERYEIRPLYGERILTPPPGEELTSRRLETLLREISPRFSAYVAQPRESEAQTLCFAKGRPVTRRQDHILFGLRTPSGAWDVVPGALTRVSTGASQFVASELGGGSKDTWVESASDTPVTVVETELRRADARPPAHFVTSRVAESFYWVGRYLERAFGLANMIATIEELETEELNPTERQLYRPVWNKILPPLENSDRVTRRTISSAAGRYLLSLDPEESGSVASSVARAGSNAGSVLDALSVEACEILARLGAAFAGRRPRKPLSDERMSAASRKVCGRVRSLVPEFFGMAEATIVVDGGWRFCLLGQLLERAVITANALSILPASLLGGSMREGEHAREIRLAAFLRMLSCRDAYRRIYQARVEPHLVASMLWGNPCVPRSVGYCLKKCLELLHESMPGGDRVAHRALHEIQSLLTEIERTDWQESLNAGHSGEAGAVPAAREHSEKLMARVLALHMLVTDGFLNHQIHLLRGA